MKILPLPLSLVNRGNNTAVTEKIHRCHAAPTRLQGQEWQEEHGNVGQKNIWWISLKREQKW